MTLATALAPVLGFIFALLAYWSWSRAKEAGMDASLQQRLWDHSKYQRDFDKATPLEVSRWFKQERQKFIRLSIASVLLALLCFGYLFYTLSGS